MQDWMCSFYFKSLWPARLFIIQICGVSRTWIYPWRSQFLLFTFRNSVVGACVIMTSLKRCSFLFKQDFFFFVHSSKLNPELRPPPGHLRYWVGGPRLKTLCMQLRAEMDMTGDLPACWLVWAEWGVSMAPGLAVAASSCGSVDEPASGAPAAFSAASVFPLPSAHTHRKWHYFNILQSVTRVQSCYMSLSGRRLPHGFWLMSCEHPLNMKYISPLFPAFSPPSSFLLLCVSPPPPPSASAPQLLSSPPEKLHFLLLLLRTIMRRCLYYKTVRWSRKQLPDLLPVFSLPSFSWVLRFPSFALRVDVRGLPWLQREGEGWVEVFVCVWVSGVYMWMFVCASYFEHITVQVGSNKS